MSHSRRVARNALWSVLQVAVNGGLYLVLYRYLYETVGVEQLGVWSLVMAWTSVNSVASLGLGGGTLYFIPKYLARGDRPYVREIVETAALSTAVLIGAGLAVFYPIVRLVLRVVIPDAALLPTALAILPYAFASVWLSTTGNLVYSSVDGFQRVDLRNRLLIGGGVVFLAASFVLVPRYGILGVAQAQLLQAAVVLVGSWTVLRHLLPELPLLPRHWSRRAFKEMIGYSVRFQAVAIAQLLFEPLTKSLLTAFGSVSATGYFEMAHRLAVQLRALVVVAHTAIAPTLTNIAETAPAMLREVYTTSCRLMAFLLVLLVPLLVALAPLVSRLWLGTFDPTFILYAMLLFAGWFGTLFGNPAYVGYLGEGSLRWIVRSHVLMAILNVVLSGGLGSLFGATGVVVGYVLALLSGSVLVAVAYEREHHYGWGSWAAPDTARLAAGALAAMGTALWLTGRWAPSMAPVPLTVVTLALFATVAGGPAWHHAARRQVAGWVRRAIAARRVPTL